MVTTERSVPSDWEARPSILAQLRAWSAKHPLRPEDGSPPALCDPDEIPIVWAQQPGQQLRLWFRKEARDADEQSAVDAVVSAMERLPQDLASSSQDAAMLLYQSVLRVERPAFGLIVTKLRERKVCAAQVRASARWLLVNATHGEAIELGIFLSGATKDRDALPDLQVLAWHHAFWLIGVWTLDFFAADTVDLWWARASGAGSDGRRRAFLRLAPRLADRPDVRDWILRRGSRGCNLAGYAAACAIAGDLAGALDRLDLDAELFGSVCYLVLNSLSGGENGIEAYPDGVVAVERLIGHLLDRCATLRQLDLVRRIGQWLEWPTDTPTFERPRRIRVAEADAVTVATGVWERREALGWTEEARASLTDDCLRILRRPEWSDRIREAFIAYAPRAVPDQKDWDDPWTAWALAPLVGVDLWEAGLRLFELNPLDGGLISRLLDTSDLERAERVVRLAERLVPRALHAARSERAQVRRPDQPDAILGALLRAMTRHSIYSDRLVALALRRPRVRCTAAGVLKQRPPDQWDEEVVAALHLAAGFEPHEDARECRPLLLERLEQLEREDRWP